MPRVARRGRSVQRRTVPINKERCAASIRRLRVFEQTTKDSRESVAPRGSSSHWPKNRGLTGVLPKWWSGEFSPPLRGGEAARSRKSREASLARADGVVFNLSKILWNLITTPSAPVEEASRHFIDVASTP